MTNIILDNPFNCEALFTDIDPMYAVTAEDRDLTACLLYLPEIADLTTYVEARYLFDYEKTITGAVERGDVKLNRSTKKVPRPVAARVSRCQIKWLEASRKDYARQGIFNLDAVMAVDVEIFQPKNQVQTADRWIDWKKLVKSNLPLRTDHVHQWYRIRGYMDLIGRKTKLAQSITIYDRKDKRREIRYTDSLVPVLSTIDLDAEAERVLKKYGMKKAIDSCCRVDAMMLARKMGLTVIPARLSKGTRIRGELYLHDASVEIYDNGMKSYISVKAGTILYDPVVCDSQERINETILHECVHFDLHWLFFTLQREYNDCVEYLACLDSRIGTCGPEDTYVQWLEDESQGESVHGGMDSSKNWTDIEWAEWQARCMTPRIQMPAKQTKRKIESLIQKYAGRRSKGIAAVYAKVIPELAQFYHVSWTTAKIRMIELGYQEARGVLNYVDGGYIPAYTTSTGKIEPGTSYDISEVDAEKLYKSDLLFASVVDSGKFVYVESHYCLDEPRFVRRDRYGIRLTENARRCVDLCCLQFRIRYGYRGGRFDSEALHNDDLRSDPIAVALAAIPLEVLLGVAADKTILVADLPVTFGKTLKHHRLANHMTQEELAELLDVSRESISRYENAKKPSISKQMIVKIGVALKLRGEYTEDLLDKAKLGLDLTDAYDNALRFVIYYLYPKGLDVCAEFLRSRKFLPKDNKNQSTMIVS